MRKYLVAKTGIKKGDALTKKNTIAKRTGKEGLSPMAWEQMEGWVAEKDFQEEELL